MPAVRAEDSEVIHSDSDRTVDYDVDDYLERTAQRQGASQHMSRSRVKLSLMSGTSAAPEQEGLDADQSNNSDGTGKCYQ